MSKNGKSGYEEIRLVKRNKGAKKNTVITVAWRGMWDSLKAKKVTHYIVDLGGSRGSVPFASKECAISRFHEQIGYLIMHGYEVVKESK